MLGKSAPQSEALGHLGSTFYNDTTNHTGLAVGIIYCIAGCTFTGLVSDFQPDGTTPVMAGTLASITLSPGMVVYGLFTRIQLATGSVIAYNA
jgi:hypothetical protein